MNVFAAVSTRKSAKAEGIHGDAGATVSNLARISITIQRLRSFSYRIEGYQSENSSLRRRIDALEKSNQSLLGQLKKLQQQFSPSGSPTTATALIVTNSHGSTFDGTTTSRGSSNVHHTVSLAVSALRLLELG